MGLAVHQLGHEWVDDVQFSGRGSESVTPPWNLYEMCSTVVSH